MGFDQLYEQEGQTESRKRVARGGGSRDLPTCYRRSLRSVSFYRAGAPRAYEQLLTTEVSLGPIQLGGYLGTSSTTEGT
jgi:hypothetical protein